METTEGRNGIWKNNNTDTRERVTVAEIAKTNRKKS